MNSTTTGFPFYRDSLFSYSITFGLFLMCIIFDIFIIHMLFNMYTMFLGIKIKLFDFNHGINTVIAVFTIFLIAGEAKIACDMYDIEYIRILEVLGLFVVGLGFLFQKIVMDFLYKRTMYSSYERNGEYEFFGGTGSIERFKGTFLGLVENSMMNFGNCTLYFPGGEIKQKDNFMCPLDILKDLCFTKISKKKKPLKLVKEMV